MFDLVISLDLCMRLLLREEIEKKNNFKNNQFKNLKSTGLQSWNEYLTAACGSSWS